MDGGKWLHLGVILTAFGALFLLSAVHSYRRFRKLEREGVETDGRVVDRAVELERNRTDGPSSEQHYLTIEYTTPDARVFSHRFKTGEVFYETHAPGSKVRILYMPEAPEKASLVNAAWTVGNKVLFPVLVGGGMVLAGLALAFFAHRA